MTIFFVPFILSLSVVFARANSPPIGGNLATYSHNSNFYFLRDSFLIILIFLYSISNFFGGMLVLFIYVASLASNESFKLSILSTTAVVMGSLTVSTIFMFLDPLFSIQPVSVQHSFLSAKNIPDFFSVSTHFIYNFPTMTLNLVVILYLLFTLIAVVEMTSVLSGPLRLSK